MLIIINMVMLACGNEARGRTREVSDLICDNNYYCSISSSFLSCSEERESLLTREIEDMKGKLMTKTDKLYEALKTSNSEV